VCQYIARGIQSTRHCPDSLLRHIISRVGRIAVDAIYELPRLRKLQVRAGCAGTLVGKTIHAGRRRHVHTGEAEEPASQRRRWRDEASSLSSCSPSPWPTYTPIARHTSLPTMPAMLPATTPCEIGARPLLHGGETSSIGVGVPRPSTTEEAIGTATRETADRRQREHWMIIVGATAATDGPEAAGTQGQSSLLRAFPSS
jgi:hypothetical protein